MSDRRADPTEALTQAQARALLKQADLAVDQAAARAGQGGHPIARPCPHRRVIGYTDDRRRCYVGDCSRGAGHPGDCAFPEPPIGDPLPAPPLSPHPCDTSVHLQPIRSVGTCSANSCRFTGCLACITDHHKRTGHTWQPWRPPSCATT